MPGKAMCAGNILWFEIQLLSIAALEALAQLSLVALQHDEGVCKSAVAVCLSQQCDNQGVVSATAKMLSQKSCLSAMFCSALAIGVAPLVLLHVSCRWRTQRAGRSAQPWQSLGSAAWESAAPALVYASCRARGQHCVFCCNAQTTPCWLGGDSGQASCQCVLTIVRQSTQCATCLCWTARPAGPHTPPCNDRKMHLCLLRGLVRRAGQLPVCFDQCKTEHTVCHLCLEGFSGAPARSSAPPVSTQHH